jgi:hypothetical protein
LGGRTAAARNANTIGRTVSEIGSHLPTTASYGFLVHSGNQGHEPIATVANAQ